MRLLFAQQQPTTSALPPQTGVPRAIAIRQSKRSGCPNETAQQLATTTQAVETRPHSPSTRKARQTRKSRFGRCSQVQPPGKRVTMPSRFSFRYLEKGTYLSVTEGVPRRASRLNLASLNSPGRSPRALFLLHPMDCGLGFETRRLRIPYPHNFESSSSLLILHQKQISRSYFSRQFR
jgi:hypothetical protein